MRSPHFLKRSHVYSFSSGLQFRAAGPFECTFDKDLDLQFLALFYALECIYVARNPHNGGHFTRLKLFDR